MWPVTLVLACVTAPAVVADELPGLSIEQSDTPYAYFAYHGQPLLSFGGLSDFMFYAADDAYAYQRWATWASEHGMNHVRAYPPLSWLHQEAFTRENGGDVKHVVFPYLETSPGSRQFDLGQWNPAYWNRFRQQLHFLRQKGIIVHLLLWNGWQLRTSQSHASPTARFDWAGHFFNPDNNVNAFTDHLREDNRTEIYHCVTNGETQLTASIAAWFEKLAEISAEFDNVYFDLVHELAEHQGQWSATQEWIEHMARAVRRGYAKRSARQAIMGMDTGGLSREQREWIFSRPYFDLLIFGKKHTLDNVRAWRQQFQKPYVPQESWDDNGQKYRMIYPEDRVHIRKYMWKFMLAGCQQMDLYIKPLNRPGDASLAKFPHNYDPRGHNAFEDDALVLRSFWNRLIDYPNLRVAGTIHEAPGEHRLLLASPRELVLYLSSGTGQSHVEFGPSMVRIDDLPLPAGENYRLDIVDPEGKQGVRVTRLLQVADPGKLDIELPAFTDEIVVHVTASRIDPESARPVRFTKKILTDKYYCDGIAAGDINRDGHVDLVAGPFWYAGPDFDRTSAFYEPVALRPEASPSNSMFSFVHDFSGDGWPDILVLGRVHMHPAIWYENPGNASRPWSAHYAFERVRGESPTMVDLDANGLPQVICHWEDRWGSIEPLPGAPGQPWRFKPIGEAENWPQFYHGEGVGDLDADGRLDLIINDGWYRQPEEPDSTAWPFQRRPFSPERGGAQMYAYDVDGDGDQDVISARHAHEWGLAWYEQKRQGSDFRFREHLIMGDRDQARTLGAAFSQPHALALADIDGDGLQDIVTGKRMWAHGPHGDVEPNADPVLYWFRLVRQPAGDVRFVPHAIDDRSGVGVQLQALDVNGDGRSDILTVSKLGAFVFLNQGIREDGAGTALPANALD
jgi:hypothetical protein